MQGLFLTPKTASVCPRSKSWRAAVWSRNLVLGSFIFLQIWTANITTLIALSFRVSTWPGRHFQAIPITANMQLPTHRIKRRVPCAITAPPYFSAKNFFYHFLQRACTVVYFEPSLQNYTQSASLYPANQHREGRTILRTQAPSQQKVWIQTVVFAQRRLRLRVKVSTAINLKIQPEH